MLMLAHTSQSSVVPSRVNPESVWMTVQACAAWPTAPQHEHRKAWSCASLILCMGSSVT